ncbi:MAG: hypothetical protein ACI9VS_002932, partial [Candidatus Binatia bacterium]
MQAATELIEKECKSNDARIRSNLSEEGFGP